jgi:hypothetical protein
MKSGERGAESESVGVKVSQVVCQRNKSLTVAVPVMASLSVSTTTQAIPVASPSSNSLPSPARCPMQPN